LSFADTICLFPWDEGNANCASPHPETQVYYNITSGLCEKVWYLGCDGNKNYFPTKGECEKFCVLEGKYVKKLNITKDKTDLIF
jgi:Kunitz/Bovine pancreatic trypsin inhibitor domain